MSAKSRHKQRKRNDQQAKSENRRGKREERREGHRVRDENKPAPAAKAEVVTKPTAQTQVVTQAAPESTRPSVQRFFKSCVARLEPQHLLNWGDWPAIIAELGEKLKIQPRLELLAMLTSEQYLGRVSAEAYMAVFHLLNSLRPYLDAKSPFFSDGSAPMMDGNDGWGPEDNQALKQRLNQLEPAWEQAVLKAKSGQPEKLLQALITELGGDDGQNAPTITPLELPALFEEAGLEVVNLSVDQITRNPDQPRTKFPEHTLKSLGESLKAGQLQPIVVFKTENDQEYDYMLFAGERRLRAAKMVGKPTLRAIVINRLNPKHLFVAAMLENEHREQLDEFDEARAFARMIDEYGMNVGSIAFHCGRSIQTVRSRLKLLKLHPQVQAMIGQHVPESERLPMPVACLISSLPHHKQIECAIAFKRERIRVNDALPWLTRHLEGSGLTVGSGDSPKRTDDLRSLIALLETLHAKCLTFGRMPRERFIKMCGVRPPDFMRSLIARLAEDIKDLQRLEQQLRFCSFGETPNQSKPEVKV